MNSATNTKVGVFFIVCRRRVVLVVSSTFKMLVLEYDFTLLLSNFHTKSIKNEHVAVRCCEIQHTQSMKIFINQHKTKQRKAKEKLWISKKNKYT